jgi:hypothetical protein
MPKMGVLITSPARSKRERLQQAGGAAEPGPQLVLATWGERATAYVFHTFRRHGNR